MVDLMHCLTNSLFFDISLLYYYTSLNLSVVCCLFTGDIYLSFGNCYSSFSSLFCVFLDFFETFILSAILLPIKLSVASAVFWIALFEAVFIASAVDFFLRYQEFFDHTYCLNSYLFFFAKEKNPHLFTYILSLFYPFL